MNIIELIVKATSQGVKEAQREMDGVASSAKKATTETSKLEKGLSDLKNAPGPIGEVAGKIDDLKGNISSVTSAARMLPPVLIAAASAAGILAAVRFAPVLDALGDLSTQLGMSASEVAALDGKLASAGGAKAYMSDLDKIARALSRADEESSRAAQAFEFLGINVKESSSPLDAMGQVMEMYAEKVQTGNLTLDEQQALILALGPAYKEMIFRQQEAALAMATYNEFAQQGLFVSKAGIDAAGEMGDAQDRLSYVFKIMGSQLVADIVPAFSSLINALANSYKNGGLVYAAFNLLRAGADLMMIPIRAAINVFIDLDTAIQAVGKSFVAVWNAISTKSLDPLKALGDEIGRIRAEQEKLKVGALGWSGSGGDAGPQLPKGLPTGRTGFNPSSRTPKASTTPKISEEDRLLNQLLSGTAVRKTQEMMKSIALLDKAFFAGKITAVEYDQAMELLTGKYEDAEKAAERYRKEQEKQNDILADQISKLTQIGQLELNKATFQSRTTGMSGIERDLTSQQDNLAAQTATAIAALNPAADGYIERLARIREEEAKTSEALKQAADARVAYNADWTNGAKNAFAKYIDEVGNTAKQTEDLFAKGFSGMENLLTDFVASGEADIKGFFAMMLREIANYIVRTMVLAPVLTWLKGLLTFGSGGVFSGGAPSAFAKGGVFTGGKVNAFASGGVVTGPTLFPMRGGELGLMGEAGPEAIMPLKRGADGKLGVAGGGSTSIAVNNSIVVQINSVDSQERQAELVREIQKTVDAQTKKTLADQMRPGGMLSRAAAR